MRLLAAGLLLLAVPAAAGAAALPASSVEIADRHGQVLRTVLSAGEAVSRPVPLEEVSPWLVLATLAAEDRRFYTHAGVDLQAAARALWQNARAGHTVSGGSTISEQLVRAWNPRPRTLASKVIEALEALLLERRCDKRSILEGYLNNVSYGGTLRGAEAAARAFFGVPARDLSLGQAALLAGIPKSPARYDPRRHPEAAFARQRRVLRRMLAWGWLDERTHRLAEAETIRVAAGGRSLLAPHFTEFARGKDGSGQVRTTLDAQLQQRLEEILRSHLSRLAAWRVTNGAVVALDNATGEVLAWVGSADYFDARHDGAVDGVLALRQPGSALKPFAYGLALARGLKASDILQDTPAFFPGGFAPRNYDETFHGPVRAREALACSYNVPAARLAERLGAARLLEGLRGFGLESLREGAEHYGLGLVLGNGEVTLLELANAYAALARGGVWRPWSVLRGGPAAAARRALDRESAYIVTSMLSDNAARAPAFGLNSPFHLPFPFAAKTGTTKDYRDNWALGYTPDWTVGVWVGNFDGTSMRRVSGISGAGPILRDAAVEMERRYGARPFPVPAGIRELEVCADSGGLPGPWCPARMREVFSVRHLPDKTCSLHHAPAVSPAGGSPRLAVEFPRSGDVFRLDPTAPPDSQAIRLRASGAGAGALWTVDGRELAESGASAWWTLQPGRHRAGVVSGAFRAAVSFMVLP